MKNNNYIIIFCVFTLSVFSVDLFSQGCNDAGFCSMGDMKPSEPYDSTKKATLVGLSSIRLGEKEAMLLALQLQFNYSLWEGGKVSLSAPLQLIYGNLGFVSGLGDITPSFTQTIVKKENSKISISVGSKIPLYDGNIKKNNEPLPMAYQPSQGTWDAILGVNYFYKKWHFSFAGQHNFNANENEYIDSLKTMNSSISYFDSQKIDRGDDILFRVEKSFEKNGRGKYFISLLPIYRIQEATILSPSGERISVKGSSGLTLNVNAGMHIYSGDKGRMKLLAGFPLVARHVRPDGLTGIFVISFSSTWGL